MNYPRTVAAIAAASLLAAFAAQATKGAAYQAPKAEPNFPRYTLTGGVTYLEPALDGLDYLEITSITGISSDEKLNTKTYSVDPGFDFGYFMGFGYMISDRYDVQATWTLLNSENNDSTSGIVGTDVLMIGQVSSGTVYPPLGEGNAFSAASEANLNYQMADATLGQYHRLTDYLTTRFFAGLTYAKIKSDVSNAYLIETGSAKSMQTIETTVHATEIYNSSFWGVGPEFGLDLLYDIYSGFDVVGHFAVALLVGELETETLSTYQIHTIDANILGNSESQTRMIPALNGKLGLNYTRPFSDNKYRLGIEGGYQVAYYFNAVDQMQEDLSGFLHNGTPVVISHNYTDVGIMGPYLNVSASF